ncbi:glycerol-3-phosphate abc transporter, periplasmic glycerol-3-phosphate-binding protein [hydrocarbon metagenome]|uniref:Glycerol-3-phosphate abc transporter, periplasmic glycerol-3-phosphate-binding protein n=1 Tax=hydrocarbon metagenome TaxID=938273 RepID=A0A0W8E2J8_9ZZZZ
MKRNFLASVLLIIMMVSPLAGCGEGVKIDPSNPVTLNLWHNYGGQLKETMDNMVDEFNETLGTEQGIIINVTSISGSATLHEKLTMAAHGDPGAPDLPDITTAYPKTALILADKGLLTDLNSQFSDQELSAYIPEFLEEGRINGDSLYVFPTAKSTEVLFVNTTLFNRFARNTGAKIEDLKSFEGIVRTASLYYEWTDQQTPNVADDGKMFYMPDSLFNFSFIGCKQLGAELINDGKFCFSSPQYKRVWDCYYQSAVLGKFAVFDGYATDLAKTGDIVCSTGSTAGISFFSPTVTYADNTSEPAELTILPYPVFEGGKKAAIQRGAGMCVIKSTLKKENAAAVFLKWFTSPENNLRFVSSTGYLPVTEEAFGEIMSKEIDNVSDNSMKKLLQTGRTMQQEYEFYIPPLFDGIDELQKEYESQLREVTTDSRASFLNNLSDSDKNTAYKTLAPDAFDDFINRLSKI